MKCVVYIQGEKCIIPGYKLHCKSDMATPQQTVSMGLGGTFILDNGDLLHISPAGQMMEDVQEYGVEFGLESGRHIICMVYNSSEEYCFEAGSEYLSEDACPLEDNTIIRIWDDENVYDNGLSAPWSYWDEPYMWRSNYCELIATLRVNGNEWVLEDNSQYLPQEVGSSRYIWSNCHVFDEIRYSHFCSTSIILNEWVEDIVYAPTDRAPFSAQRSDNGLYCYIFTQEIYTKAGDQIHIITGAGTASYEYNGALWVQIAQDY